MSIFYSLTTHQVTIFVEDRALVVYEPDIWSGGYNFENAVDVTLIDEAEFGITEPFEARGDNFDCCGAHHVKPLCLKQVFRDIAVYILRLRLSDKQFFVPVVKVELQSKVWREQIGNRWEHCQVFWEPLYTIVQIPLHLLASILRFTVCSCIFHWLARVVQIFSIIDCAYIIVRYFQQSSRILTQVKSLLWLWIDIPIKLFKLRPIDFFNQIE